MNKTYINVCFQDGKFIIDDTMETAGSAWEQIDDLGEGLQVLDDIGVDPNSFQIVKSHLDKLDQQYDCVYYYYCYFEDEDDSGAESLVVGYDPV